MEFSYSTPVKGCQNAPKLSKSHNQTREGDWVCFNCNNLNFSFRKKCNRCKTLTRKQNQDLQNAYTLYFYNQHQESTLYPYENNPLYHQTTNDQPYYALDINSINTDEQNPLVQGQTSQNSLSFSRNHQNQQIIQVTITSPFKEILNTNDLFQQKFNKKLRTPSSKKKRPLKKKNDLLPSVSPLLKKLLAKEDTHNKNNKQKISNTKDPLNVALFYDEVWDNNKQSVISLPFSTIEHKDQSYMSNSGKKIMKNSRIQKTNDSVNNVCEQNEFAYQMKSPERETNDDEIIEIDEGDEELAQIISRIMV